MFLFLLFVSCNGVPVIDYNQPSMENFKQHDNKLYKMFNRLLREKISCWQISVLNTCVWSFDHLIFHGEREFNHLKAQKNFEV